jgi:hypothetical protein
MVGSPALARQHGTAIFAAALVGGRGEGGDVVRGKAGSDAADASVRGHAARRALVRRWLAGAPLGPP